MTTSSTVELVARGLWNTTLLTATAAAVAIPCALLAGTARVSRDPILRAIATVYVESFRGTSALIQLYWFFFALPILVGIEMSAFAAAVSVLGLNIGAYGAEVVRAAVDAVPRGQHEAAVVLGLSRYQRMRHVILPQAAPQMLPPAGNLCIELLKATALVSMITIPDLTFAANRMREHTMRTGLSYGAALLLYFALATVISTVVRRAERHFSRHLTQTGAV